MVEVIAVLNCDECGQAFLDKIGIDENQLIDRGVTLQDIKNRPNENRTKLNIRECKFHKDLEQIDRNYQK